MAAPSAVSTGCTRLPIAKTPGLLVRRHARPRGRRSPGPSPGPGAGQFVIGDPVAGHDDRVALDHPRAGVDVFHFHGSTRSRPLIRTTRLAGEHRHSIRNRPARETRRTTRTADIRRHPTVLQPASRKVNTADQLTSSAPTITARRPTSAWWTWTWFCNSPVVKTPSGRSPGMSARAADVRVHPWRASRRPRDHAPPRGDVTCSPLPCPVRHHRRVLDQCSGFLGQCGQPPGVVGPGHDPLEVSQAVSGMVAVARNASGLGFPFDDQHLAGLRRRERGRSSEPGRPASDDRDRVRSSSLPLASESGRGAPQ